MTRQWAVHQLPDAGCKPDELLYLAASATLLDANDDTVRFVHQLIQEYFAALAWKERLATDNLKQYWPEGWLEAGDWDETTVLLAGMLDEMTPLVEKLLPVNPALAARCIGASGGACKETTKATVRQALEADCLWHNCAGAGAQRGRQRPQLHRRHAPRRRTERKRPAGHRLV